MSHKGPRSGSCLSCFLFAILFSFKTDMKGMLFILCEYKDRPRSIENDHSTSSPSVRIDFNNVVQFTLRSMEWVYFSHDIPCLIPQCRLLVTDPFGVESRGKDSGTLREGKDQLCCLTDLFRKRMLRCISKVGRTILLSCESVVDLLDWVVLCSWLQVLEGKMAHSGSVMFCYWL